jgi:hypothetical protein
MAAANAAYKALEAASDLLIASCPGQEAADAAAALADAATAAGTGVDVLLRASLACMRAADNVLRVKAGQRRRWTMADSLRHPVTESVLQARAHLQQHAGAAPRLPGGQPLPREPGAAHVLAAAGATLHATQLGVQRVALQLHCAAAGGGQPLPPLYYELAQKQLLASASAAMEGALGARYIAAELDVDASDGQRSGLAAGGTATTIVPRGASGPGLLFPCPEAHAGMQCMLYGCGKALNGLKILLAREGNMDMDAMKAAGVKAASAYDDAAAAVQRLLDDMSESRTSAGARGSRVLVTVARSLRRVWEVVRRGGRGRGPTLPLRLTLDVGAGLRLGKQALMRREGGWGLSSAH